MSKPGYYDHLDFNAPLSDATADLLVARLASAGPSTILDVGCGWAELLLRLLATCSEAQGHGIDHDDGLVDRAQRNAHDRDLADRVAFSADLSGTAPAELTINIGAEHVFGTLEDAIGELWKLVLPGGQLLLGTQFWEQEPSADVAAFIGALPTIDELVEMTTTAGWRPLSLRTATLQEWDAFEFDFIADWEQVVMAGPSAGSDEAVKAADEHRKGYLQRRGTLGFAYLTLGRPQS